MPAVLLLTLDGSGIGSILPGFQTATAYSAPDQLNNQAMHQPMNQSTNESTNESTNKSTN